MQEQNLLIVNAKQSLMFLVVGAVNTLLGMVVFYALYQLYNEHISAFFISLAASVIGLFISTFNYRFFVFGSHNKLSHTILRAIITYATLWILNGLFYQIMLESMGFNIIVSQIIGTLLSVCILYFMHKNFTYKK
jgi:putative flippase GtrA